MLPALSEADLIAIQEGIKTLDPTGRYVKLDVGEKRIEYSSLIKSNERFTSYVGTEEPVRAYWVAWLCTTGLYPPAALELERTYRFGRSGSAQLDIRVSDAEDSSRCFAMIEIKAPHEWHGADDPLIKTQLFALTAEEPDARVLSLSTIQVGAGGAIAMVGVNIARSAGLTYSTWRRRRSPHVDTFPINYDEPTSDPFVCGGTRDLNTGLTRVQLDKTRTELHNKLWGGSRDDNQIYAWLVRLFLTKIYDERHTRKGQAYSFQVLFDGSRKESPGVTYERVNARYQEAYAAYINAEITKDEALTRPLFSHEELQWVVESLQQLSLTSVASSSGDLLGGFFEAITREGFKQSKGLFFTHYNVAVFMLEVLELEELAIEKLMSSSHTNDRLPYIIDPSCGSGTFLLAAMRMITERIAKLRDAVDTADIRDQISSKFPEHKPTEWAREYIYGIEKREDLTISTKVNMVLHRDGNTHILNDDGLQRLARLSDTHSDARFRPMAAAVEYYEHPRAETFDVVVTNPPFSVTLDAATQAILDDDFALASDRNSENLFLERWYQLLKPGGRLAAVLPESFFSTAENTDARLFLYRHFDVRAVVSLPVHAFAPWTPTRTSLLFARKKSADDERAWSAFFDPMSIELATLQRNGLAALRKLVRPGRATPKQLQDVREIATNALVEAGYEGDPLSENTPVAELEDHLKRLRAWSTSREAFSRTVGQLPVAEFLGITVEEVGYRRTKRAENSAANDLFSAFAGEGAARHRVLNLNDAADGWEILTNDAGGDALSIVREAQIWD